LEIWEASSAADQFRRSRAERRMNKLLWLVAAILILFVPIAGVYLGIPSVIVLFLPFLGIACGLAAVVRGAQPRPDADGPASPGAQADAKILSNTTLDSSPNRGIDIIDVGGLN
jgi:fatty acid desaturase